MTHVYVRDIRAARICLSGARKWFRDHDLSWQEFVRDGIAAGRLEATGDSLAFRVTTMARRREANE